MVLHCSSVWWQCAACMRKCSHMPARKSHCGLGRMTESFASRLSLTCLCCCCWSECFGSIWCWFADELYCLLIFFFGVELRVYFVNKTASDSLHIVPEKCWWAWLAADEDIMYHILLEHSLLHSSILFFIFFFKCWLSCWSFHQREVRLDGLSDMLMR